MDENKIKELWQSSNEKLEQSLLLSKKNTEDITKMKMQTLLSSMRPIKLISILAGILWVGFGSVMLVNMFINSFKDVSPFFLISAAIQLSLSAVGIIIYLYQLILIHQVDIDKPILETQEKLTNLKSSTLMVTRLLFLQLPVWTTFYWTEGMFENENIFLLLIQIIVTLLFTALAIWLFFNIKYENREKKWFRLIFAGKEWIPIIKSMELYSEIKKFKQEN